MTVWRVASGCEAGACVGVARDGDVVEVTDTKTPDGPALRFTREEIAVFFAAVKAGEFDDLLE